MVDADCPAERCSVSTRGRLTSRRTARPRSLRSRQVPRDGFPTATSSSLATLTRCRSIPPVSRRTGNSHARAVEVTKFLIANGMRPAGAGGSGIRGVRSRGGNDSPEHQAQNRRIGDRAAAESRRICLRSTRGKRRHDDGSRFGDTRCFMATIRNHYGRPPTLVTPERVSSSPRDSARCACHGIRRPHPKPEVRLRSRHHAMATRLPRPILTLLTILSIAGFFVHGESKH